MVTQKKCSGGHGRQPMIRRALSYRPGFGVHSVTQKLRAYNMDARQCGNDRPGFGVHAVSQKLRANNYKSLLGF